MRDSACRWSIIKKAKTFGSYISSPECEKL